MSPAAVTRSTCLNVAFLGARGSGEDLKPENLGMGDTVFHAFTEYSDRVKDRSVGGAGVKYPADDVLVLAQPKGRKKYFEGLDKGVTLVVATLQKFAKNCPDQHFVLAGYSQGAMVMHRAVWQLSKDKFNLSKIDGVLLIANGDRLPRKGIVQYGSAENGKGISWVLPNLSGDVHKPTKGIPTALDSRVHSVCINNDLVCDANAFHLLHGVTFAAGVANHGKYAKRKPAAGRVTDAAAAVAKWTISIPLVTDVEPPADWSIQRDQLMAEVNAARAQARWCGQVQWPAAPPLQRIPSLDAAAQAYAVRQSTEGFEGHYSPEGLGPTDRAAAEGYSGGLGEDLANGQESANQVVSAWLSSPGHCQVLMSAASVAGVGFADVSHGTAWGFLGDCSCSSRRPASIPEEN